MVFFSCNMCGEALKKNQVDKHCMTKCRGCEMVSCIDCGKDFWGNDYEQHTKCISEDQKYSGKGYVAKVNKGEAKQDRWIEQVQTAIDNNKNNPRLKGPLESIKNYPNIPRKKNKFENFLQNSLRIRDRNLISKLWDALMEEAAKHMKPSSENTSETNIPNGKVDKTENTQKENGSSENLKEEDEKKLSKRERKEERRKKMNKKEKKDKDSVEATDSVQNNEEIKPSKKKKKRKHEHEEIEETDTKGKKRKRDEEIEEEEEEVEEEEEAPVKKKTKFNWEEVITEVLQSKGEISVKKLKKKVLSEYVSQMGEPRSEDKLWSKFDKKLSKNPNFKVLKEKVKLKVRT